MSSTVVHSGYCDSNHNNLGWKAGRADCCVHNIALCLNSLNVTLFYVALYLISTFVIMLMSLTISVAIIVDVNRINLLKTKRNLLYIRNQSVPRSKLFPTRLHKKSVSDV